MRAVDKRALMYLRHSTAAITCFLSAAAAATGTVGSRYTLIRLSGERARGSRQQRHHLSIES